MDEITITPEIQVELQKILFRGILCRDCNRGLGGFKDNINFLEKAIAYLKERGS